MRIWDVNPGYLNRQSLLGEHRELHGIISIIKNKKTGYSRHPETLRWIGYGWALSQRHNLLAAEMNSRGYVDRTPATLRSQPLKWPEVFVTAPDIQYSLLSEKYKGIEQGRIPLPKTVQQLWAQHKYSVMARDYAEYQRIGKWLATRKSGNGMKIVCEELIQLLRSPPERGNLRNAVLHMWGYVAKYSSSPCFTVEKKSVRGLLAEIQRLAFLHNVSYLKESTALSELTAWKQ